MSKDSDYAHWNEEAPIIRHLENKWSDYYSDDPHYVEENHAWDDYEEEEDE